MSEDAVLFVSIDKHERDVLQHVLDQTFGPRNAIEELIWVQNTNDGRAPTYSTNHEYVEVYAKDRSIVESVRRMFREEKPGFSNVMSLVEALSPSFPPIADIEAELARLYREHKAEYRAEVESQNLDWRDEERNDPWKGLYPYKFAEYRDAAGHFVPYEAARARNARIWVFRESDWTIMSSDAKQSPTIKDAKDPNYRFYRPPHPRTGKPCAPPSRGWKGTQYIDPRHPERNSFESLARDHRIAFGDDETKVPQQKRMLHEVETNVSKSVIVDYSDGEKETFALFRKTGLFLGHKHSDFVSRFIAQSACENGTVMDYFAGTGSTGHAVIKLNRQDGGARKFILVEMGHYFDTILVPRIKKVMFAPEWSEGKPTRFATKQEAERTPHLVKVLRLESYEDALNNIVLNDTTGQQALELYGGEYLLRYMLGFESRSSQTLLSVPGLASPFSYTLRVHRDGETREHAVDLPESFSYLIGMRVQTRRVYRDGQRRYLVYRGTVGQSQAVTIWRDTSSWAQRDLERDKQFILSQKLTEGADEVFLNGDALVPRAKSLDPVFKRLMFGEVV